MNLEEYLEQNYQNIDMNIFADLFLKQKTFYTLIFPQNFPRKNEYLVQEIEGDMLGLIFTSKEKVEKYKKQESLLKDWKIKEYNTENFDSYFKDVNRKVNGFCVNYGFYWCKLLLA